MDKQKLFQRKLLVGKIDAMGIFAHGVTFLTARINSDLLSYPRSVANLCFRPLDHVIKTFFHRELFDLFFVPSKEHRHKLLWSDRHRDIVFLPETNRLLRIWKIVLSIIFSIPLYLLGLVIKIGLLIFSRPYQEQHKIVVNFLEGRLLKDSDFSKNVSKNLSEAGTPILTGLPDELICYLGFTLDALAITRLSRTCRYLHAITTQKQMWENLLPFYGLTPNSRTHPKQLIKHRFYKIEMAYSDLAIDLISINRILYMNLFDPVQGHIYTHRGKLIDPSTRLSHYEVTRWEDYSKFEFTWDRATPLDEELYENLKNLFSKSFQFEGDLTRNGMLNSPGSLFFRFLVYQSGDDIYFQIGFKNESIFIEWKRKAHILRSHYAGFVADFRNWRERFFQLAMQ